MADSGLDLVDERRGVGTAAFGRGAESFGWFRRTVARSALVERWAGAERNMAI